MSWSEKVNPSKFDLQSMSIDELWVLHEKVGAILSKKGEAEKHDLEQRLARLNRSLVSDKATISRAGLRNSDRRKVRRKYPPVLPKFQNPSNPTETWAGRGKQPRWMVAQLKAGKKVNDFLIDRSKRQSLAKRRQPD